MFIKLTAGNWVRWKIVRWRTVWDMVGLVTLPCPALPYFALPYRLYNGRRLGTVVDCWTADWMGHGRASDFALLCLTIPCFAIPCFALPYLALPCRLYNDRKLGAVVDCWMADWTGHGGLVTLPYFALPYRLYNGRRLGAG